ncbi:proline-rich proteoglycan 2-like [Antechinus flavipes]|uniref:proline-rich proteoglycan 2-like n=1 Tax=Antechinus flavipes TaxID=38775 RepID=UPI002236BED0|nr:proline-rich proteoglycan 2-like [Antechinus flavipes]
MPLLLSPPSPGADTGSAARIGKDPRGWGGKGGSKAVPCRPPPLPSPTRGNPAGQPWTAAPRLPQQTGGAEGPLPAAGWGCQEEQEAEAEAERSGAPPPGHDPRRPSRPGPRAPAPRSRPSARPSRPVPGGGGEPPPPPQPLPIPAPVRPRSRLRLRLRSRLRLLPNAAAATAASAPCSRLDLPLRPSGATAGPLVLQAPPPGPASRMPSGRPHSASQPKPSPGPALPGRNY